MPSEGMVGVLSVVMGAERCCRKTAHQAGSGRAP